MYYFIDPVAGKRWSLGTLVRLSTFPSLAQLQKPIASFLAELFELARSEQLFAIMHSRDD